MCLLEDALPGMVLARAVTLDGGSVFLQKDLALTPRSIAVLRTKGVEHIFVKDAESEPGFHDDSDMLRVVTERETLRFGEIDDAPLMQALRSAVVALKAGQPADWDQTRPPPPAAVKDVLDRREQIHSLAKKIRALPTLPAIYQQIDEVTADSAASTGDVASVVSKDPAFAASLLRVANSALYTRSNPVTTVTVAVSVLGHKVIRDLCLIASVLEILSLTDSKATPVDVFWKHAVGVGSTAKVLAERVGGISLEEAFLAGLLHDIGFLFWLRHYPGDLAKIVAWAESSGRTVLECERDLMGTAHPRLGRMIAGHWLLPAPFIQAISFHHDPGQATGQRLLCQVTHVADSISHALEMEGPNLCRVPVIDPAAWAALGLAEDDLPDLLEIVRSEFAQNLKSFALHAAEPEPV